MSESEPQRPAHRRRRRGIYLLPNLFTTGTLFAGFYSIIAASQGEFEIAAIAIFLAMLTDMLDGRVARLTKTESDFGVQYDSLGDLVAFGLATGFLAYAYSLHTLTDISLVGGKLGWLAAFFYTAAAALRLARFNVQSTAAVERKMFVGLPSPSAAGLVAGFIWVGSDFGLGGAALVIPVLLLTVAAGGLMVSNIRYHSFKDLKLSERVPFTYILAMLAAFILISLNPPRVLFLGFLVYGASGPILAARRWQLRRRGQRS